MTEHGACGEMIGTVDSGEELDGIALNCGDWCPTDSAGGSACALQPLCWGWLSPIPPHCGQNTVLRPQCSALSHTAHLPKGCVPHTAPSPPLASELCPSIPNVTIPLSEFMGMLPTAPQGGIISTPPRKPSAFSECVNKEGIYLLFQ